MSHWIRSPTWDSFWMLSGLPIGIGLIFLPSFGRLILFTVFVSLDMGHTFSPIVLAWTHGAFRRQVVLKNVRKFVVLPLVLFSASLAIGIATSAGWTSFRNDLPHQLFQVTDITNPDYS